MFRNLKIGSRLGIGFAAMVAIVLLIAGISYSKFVAIDNNIDSIVDERMPQTAIANEIIDLANQATVAARDAILAKDPIQIKKEMDSIALASKTVGELLEKLGPAIKDDKGKALLADFQQKRAPYAGALKNVIAFINEGKKDAAINELNTKMKPAHGPYFEAISKIVEHQTALMQQEGKETAAMATATQRLVFVLAVVAVLIAIGTGILITLSITRPVVGLVGIMKSLSTGNLDFKLDTQSKDEIGMLSQAIDQVRVNLNTLISDTSLLAQAAVEGRLETRSDASKHQGDYRKVVEGVNDTLDAVIGPINEVKRVMTAMESGDLTQSINQDYQGDFAILQDAVNNSMSKLSSTVSQVTQAAAGLNTAAEQVSATAQSLSQSSSEQAASLEETTAAIEEMSSSIAQNTDNARVTDAIATQSATDAAQGGEAVKATVIAMKSIADKISIIDDIAYRTDLLALNAAIEAARAGEHGKGFAVVAAEVRKLAERSQVAAQEIGELASSSVQTAENAGALLETMVPSIRKTADLVREISGASAEQSTGTAQINQAMEQLNMATQTNAASSEELSATADEMNHQAMRLRDLMEQFVTAQATHHAKPVRESDIVVKHKKSSGKSPAKTMDPVARLYAEDLTGSFGPIN